jgi:hypothetical protein
VIYALVTDWKKGAADVCGGWLEGLKFLWRCFLMKYSGNKVRNPSLRAHFKEVLGDWAKIIEKYSKEHPGDALYLGSEKATLSTLAGAVWRNKEVALTDYSVPKDNKKRKIKGKVDLWFTFKTKEYAIEAKQETLSISRKAKPPEKQLEGALKEALKDAKEAKGRSRSKNLRYVGLVFAVPTIPPADQDKKELQERIKAFVKEADKVDCDLYAYYFNDNGKVKNGKDVLPGVAVFGKMV